MILQKIRNARTVANLITRSVDSGLNTQQNELDILEMLFITERVIEQRLSAGIYNERQKDQKRKYAALFLSIREEVLASIRDVFTNEDGKASGLVLQKYNTLALDALFDVLTYVGPENAIRVTNIITNAIRRDMLTLGVIDTFDAKVASGTLAELSRERARNARPMTKARRLAIIVKAADKVAEDRAA